MIGSSRRIAALLASALLAGPALADPRPPSEKDRRLASDLVKKAIARSQAGDHAAAIEIYLQAYTIVPNSLLLSNIGAEFQQSGMPKEALKYFCMYLEKDPSGTNAPYATAQARILQRRLGNGNVDERDVCAPPRNTTEDKAEDTADDTAEDDPKPVKPRPHTRERARADEPAAAEPAARDRGNPALRYTGVAAGIAGLAAAGLGAYYGIQAKNISDEITNHDPATPWPDGIQRREAAGQRDENLQIGFLIASGVLATTGVVLFVVGRPDHAPEHGRGKTVVRAVPTANGLAVLGWF